MKEPWRLGACPSPRLWLIGGTGEALRLAQAVVQAGIPCLVTVTTAAAQAHYPDHPRLRVRVGSLAVDTLADFMHAHGIGAILDASHPFAVAISQAAMAQANALGLPYWRYERPGESPQGDAVAQATGWQPLRVPTVDAALRADLLVGQRVLLTLGYRWLAAFQPWQGRAKLFARILPSPMALEAALGAGFTPDRIVALRPPIGEPLEQAIWQQWGITTVITKASGAPGGEDTKRRVAARLQIPLILIDRPPVAYPTVSHSLEEVLGQCSQWWQGQKNNATF